MSNFGPTKAAMTAFADRAVEDLDEVGHLSVDTIFDGMSHSLDLRLLAFIRFPTRQELSTHE